MTNFFGKLTFGFVLGQFLPGFLLVMAWQAIGVQAEHGFEVWRDPGPFLLPIGGTEIVLAIVVGLLIDGINWAGRAFLERQAGKDGKLPTETRLHSRPPVVLIAGPVGPLFCALHFIFCSRTRSLAISENVVRISNDQLGHFRWLQDFYLYAGQFYANTSLAASVALLPLALSFTGAGLFWQCVAICWFLAGLCWLLSLRTFASLFWAEACLAKGPDWTAQYEFARTPLEERTFSDGVLSGWMRAKREKTFREDLGKDGSPWTPDQINEAVALWKQEGSDASHLAFWRYAIGVKYGHVTKCDDLPPAYTRRADSLEPVLCPDPPHPPAPPSEPPAPTVVVHCHCKDGPCNCVEHAKTEIEAPAPEDGGAA